MSNIHRPSMEPWPYGRLRCGWQMSHRTPIPKTLRLPEMPNPCSYSNNYRGTPVKDQRSCGGQIAEMDLISEYQGISAQEPLPQEYQKYGNYGSQELPSQYWKPNRCRAGQPSPTQRCYKHQPTSPPTQRCYKHQPTSPPTQRCYKQQPTPPPHSFYEKQPPHSCYEQQPPQSCEYQPPLPLERYCEQQSPQSCDYQAPSPPERYCEPQSPQSCDYQPTSPPERYCDHHRCNDQQSAHPRQRCNCPPPPPRNRCNEQQLALTRHRCHCRSQPPSQRCCVQEPPSQPQWCNEQQQTPPRQRCQCQPQRYCGLCTPPPRRCSKSSEKRCCQDRFLSISLNRDACKSGDKKRRSGKQCRRKKICYFDWVVTHEASAQTDLPCPPQDDLIAIKKEELIVEEVQKVTVVPGECRKATKCQSKTRTVCTAKKPQCVQKPIKEKVDPTPIIVPKEPETIVEIPTDDPKDVTPPVAASSPPRSVPSPKLLINIDDLNDVKTPPVAASSPPDSLPSPQLMTKIDEPNPGTPPDADSITPRSLPSPKIDEPKQVKYVPLSPPDSLPSPKIDETDQEKYFWTPPADESVPPRKRLTIFHPPNIKGKKGPKRAVSGNIPQRNMKKRKEEPEPKPKRKKRKKPAQCVYPSNDLVCRMHRPLPKKICNTQTFRTGMHRPLPRKICNTQICQTGCGAGCRAGCGAGYGAGNRSCCLPCFVPCSGSSYPACAPMQCDAICGFASVPVAYYCHR